MSDLKIATTGRYTTQLQHEKRGFTPPQAMLGCAPTKTSGRTILKKHVSILAAGLMIGAAALQFSTTAFSQDGWVTLLDSSKKGDWDEVGKANWEFKDGVLAADKLAGKDLSYLVTKNSYKDFQIKAEFWTDEEANSGIFIRCDESNKIDSKICYEVNIFDKRPDPSYGTGAIVDVAKVDPMPKAGGKWNTYEITAKGPQLTVVLNGVQTVNVQNGQFAEGRVALQYGLGPNDAPGGAIKWRKVQIKSL